MRIITRRTEFGSCLGYVLSSTAPRLEHYLSGHFDEAAAIASWLRRTCDRVALIVEIHVDPAVRNKGHGTALLQECMRESQDARADVVLLLADTGHPQHDGFSITKWYEHAGFTSTLISPAGPLMAFPAAQALSLTAHLSAAPKRTHQPTP